MFTFWPGEEKQFMNKIAIVIMHIFSFNGTHCWEKEIWAWNSVTRAIMDVDCSLWDLEEAPFLSLEEVEKLSDRQSRKRYGSWGSYLSSLFLFLTGRHVQPFQEQNSNIFGYLWMCHLCGHIMDWLLKLDVFSSSLILKVTHFLVTKS